MSNGTFDFNQFINESKETLMNPKSYFSTMKTSGGLGEPVIKALIYGVIAGIFKLVWGILHLGGLAGGLFGGAGGVMSFFGMIIAAIIGLFIGAVIILIISAICKGNTDFEANARVSASLMVVLPISALFGFAPGINFYLGIFINLVINLFSLWLLYNGLVYALKANPATSRIVMYVLAALLVIFTLAGMGTARRAERFMKDFNNTDFKELMEDQGSQENQ